MKKDTRRKLSLIGALMAVIAFTPCQSWAQKDSSAQKAKEKLSMESMVITATRSEENKEEIPQRIDVIGQKDIEKTIGGDLTDVLKKNSSVDVIQYPGALSGISIRGFRPEFSGITKHSLLLIDGRPAGTTNLATIPKDMIERIEVLKGPASSLYGGQAMGGVINVITKKSKGEFKGKVNVGYGSFQTYLASAQAGGKVNEIFDVDFIGGLDVQDDDFKMGNGETRKNTSFKKYNGGLRLGADLAGDWKAQVMGNLFKGKDIYTPGDEYFGDTRPAKKNMDRVTGEFKINGNVGNHGLNFLTYASQDKYDLYKWAAVTPEYKSYSSKIDWFGAQARDTLKIGVHNLTFGVDYEKVKQTSESYKTGGIRKAPYSPDNERRTIGYYGQTVLKFMDGKLTVNGGLRYDDIELKTLATPLKNDFTPGSTKLDTVNPSAGISYEFAPGLRAHATIGKAFVPPQASQMAGYSEREVANVVMVTKGNPDLNPEKSWTWDAGLNYLKQAWGVNIDLTYFHTKVDDKIEKSKVNALTSTYVNVGDATIEGIEAQASLDIGAIAKWPYTLKLFANATNILKAEETMGQGTVKDIHNVADWKVNYGVEFDNNQGFDAKLSARYRGKVKDTDWNAPGYPELEYPTWTVFDLVTSYSPLEHHKITAEVSNLFDEYYYEKKGYSLPGRAFFLKYSFSF